jgi:Fur family peroxide stress response transcriptional regulator
MSERYGEIAGMLRARGLKSSHQRIKVIEYLSRNFCHPTADMVLNGLSKELPTLSKSTVYKTLNALVAEGLLREITIDENEVRYEYNLIDHGHFKCLRCGNIFDFNIDIGAAPVSGLEGFRVTDKNVYFKGLCPKCINYK